MMNPTTIARRDLVGLLGGIAIASAMPRTASAAGAAGASPSEALSPKLRTLMKMRAALDDRLVIYWHRGRYYGFVDGEMQPLFGVVNVCFSRYRAHADGGFIGARGEVSYYTDFDTGEVVHSVLNPYTGASMEPPARGYPPSPVRIQADAAITIKESPGMTFKNVVYDPEITADDVRLCESNMARTPLPGGRVSLYNEVLTYRARASDLARADLARVPCDLSFTNTVSWRSWMNMGNRPGQMMAIGSGSYVSSVEEVPSTWRSATALTQPQLLAKPMAFLEPLWKSMS